MRERIYGSRKITKYAARVIVKGSNGYGFVQCASNATPEVIESTGEDNRAIVAMLLHKQGLVFLVRRSLVPQVFVADPGLAVGPL